MSRAKKMGMIRVLTQVRKQFHNQIRLIGIGTTQISKPPAKAVKVKTPCLFL